MLTKPRLAGWSLVAAAPLLLAADLVRSDHGEPKYASQLADVATSRGPELAAASLFLLAAILLIPAAIGLGGLVRGRGAWLTLSGAILLGVGALWIAAGRAMYSFLLYALASPKLPQATAATSLDHIGNSSAFAIFLPLLLALMVAPVLLAIGLWRAGLGRWWIAPVWLVAAVVYAGGAETSTLGSLVSFGPMMAALAYLGIQVLRTNAASTRGKTEGRAPSQTALQTGSATT
jgi:hypothetical protein